MTDRIEENQYRQDGFTQRQYNLHKELRVCRSVQLCRLQQVIRDTLLEEGTGHNQVPGADCPGQDQCPHRVNQSQVPDMQVSRNQACGKDHRESNHHHEDVASHQVFPGQGISSRNRQHHVYQRTYPCINQRIAITGKEGLILQNPPVSVHRHPDGIQDHPAGIHVHRIRNGGDHNKIQRISHYQETNRQNHIIHDIERFVHPGLAYFQPAVFRRQFGLQHTVSSFP